VRAAGRGQEEEEEEEEEGEEGEKEINVTPMINFDTLGESSERDVIKKDPLTLFFLSFL